MMYNVLVYVDKENDIEVFFIMNKSKSQWH